MSRETRLGIALIGVGAVWYLGQFLVPNTSNPGWIVQLSVIGIGLLLVAGGTIASSVHKPSSAE